MRKLCRASVYVPLLGALPVVLRPSTRQHSALLEGCKLQAQNDVLQTSYFCDQFPAGVQKETLMCEQSGFQVSGEAAKLRERYSLSYFWAPGLVALAALQRGERVLDVACGTGLVARLAAPEVGSTGQVTGLDNKAGMLAVARSSPPPSGASITWVQGNAGAMDFPDASFEVILCQQGLQFFPDKPTALREMHRVLVPGGRVLLSVWKSTGPPYNLAVGEALERHVGLETATKFRASRVVPDAEALYRLLVEAGFRAVEIRPSAMTIRLPTLETFVPGYLSANPVAGAVAALSDEQRAALTRQVKTALQPYADGDGVAVPDEINIAMGKT